MSCAISRSAGLRSNQIKIVIVLLRVTSWMTTTIRQTARQCWVSRRPLSAPSEVKFVSLMLYLIGSLSDISPSAAASSFEEDLLHDDLPSNTKFVTKSSRTNGRQPSSTGSAEIEIAHKETITILSRKPFSLYEDYLTELEESKAKSDSLRQVTTPQFH